MIIRLSSWKREGCFYTGIASPTFRKREGRSGCPSETGVCHVPLAPNIPCSQAAYFGVVSSPAPAPARGTRTIPGHLHPPFQVQATAGLLGLETRGVHFVAAEGLGEVCGILGWQAAGGRQARGALGMTHHLTFWGKAENTLADPGPCSPLPAKPPPGPNTQAIPKLDQKPGPDRERKRGSQVFSTRCSRLLPRPPPTGV